MKFRFIILFILLSPFIVVAQSLNNIEIGDYYNGVELLKSPSLSFDLSGEIEGLFGELNIRTAKTNIVHQLSFHPKVKGLDYNYFINKKQTFHFIENIEAKFNVKFIKKNRYEGSMKITYYRVTKDDISYYLRTATFDNGQSFLINLTISHAKISRKYYNIKNEMEARFLRSNTYKT